MDLTPFEIMCGHPPPVISSLQTDLMLAALDDQDLFNAIQWLQSVHKIIWPKLRAIYEPTTVPTPYKFRPGDWVFIWRHHPKLLKPR